MAGPLCVVVGIGPGTGLAVARKFAEQGYKLAFTARSEERLKRFEAELPGSRSYRWDVQDTDAAEGVFERIRSDLGPMRVLVYNTGPGAFKNFDDTTLEELQSAWEINTRGLFVAVKAALPDLRSEPGANLIIMGATASLRGGAGAAPFASAKTSQRALAQSLARYLGPQRIHVSYLILDGVINTPEVLEMLPGKDPDFFLDADGIAEAAYAISQQPKQAWTFELDLRPFGEKW